MKKSNSSRLCDFLHYYYKPENLTFKEKINFFYFAALKAFLTISS